MDSTIDLLMSECYRTPWITQFFHLLINGGHSDPECESHFASWLPPITPYSRSSLHPRKRRLFQLEAPPNLIDKAYSTCFRKFLEMVR